MKTLSDFAKKFCLPSILKDPDNEEVRNEYVQQFRGAVNYFCHFLATTDEEVEYAYDTYYNFIKAVEEIQERPVKMYLYRSTDGAVEEKLFCRSREEAELLLFRLYEDEDIEFELYLVREI